MAALLFVSGLYFSNQGNSMLPPLAIIASVFLFIGSLIFAQLVSTLVTPKRMTDDYIWLKGVHPDYLNRLEVWGWNI